MLGGKMKAIVKNENAFGAILKEIPIPSINENEVLIKVQAASICGTDVHIYNWDQWAQKRIKTPQVFGHEFSGIVAETGKHVTNVKIGDYVSAETHFVCGTCVPCLTGKHHVCTHTKILGVDTAGSFAEYVKVPAQMFGKTPLIWTPPSPLFKSRLATRCIRCWKAAGLRAVPLQLSAADRSG